jgi:hypothetical protein
MLVFPIVAAALWSAICAEMVIESARAHGRQLVLFGNVVAAPSVSVTIVVLCVVSATAALAMVTAVAYARGRRLERRMVAELDARWGEISERDAGDAARRELLSWRVVELQTLVDTLVAQRDAARELLYESGISEGVVDVRDFGAPVV